MRHVTAKESAGVVASLRAGDVRGLLARHADLALAALVVAMVGMMIVPLPTPLLDLCISVNIAAAVTLLLVALYVSDALKIATFPTLLLLTTLYRLAIEVSATRLILLHANAGAVIRAFGDFVVAGNLVVGVVVFLILTVIQFVVISKGAERIAEVAARFTLDAMPGKQLAIDAELRAGAIDAAKARRRRAALARESQLYGSMDGAMKFVKGDAVAGIVVLLVNVVGGLIVGVFQRGMDAAAAARTYTVLTIGEGLVAQIPALVISTAAGIIVTRVASEEEAAGGAPSHLGRDIGLQIAAHPKALAVTAGLLGLLALVPGLPAAPFLALAALLGLGAWRLFRTAAPRPATAPAAAAVRAASTPLPSPAPTPIAVDAGTALAAALGARFEAVAVPALRDRLFRELGIPLPAVALRAGAPGLPPTAYVLRLNEVPLARGEIPPAALGQASEQITDALRALIGRHGHELIGIEETQALLAGLERSHPALVREVVPKLVSAVLLAEVLRRLAEERISLRNLPDVLGALADQAPRERDPAALVERTRAALRRSITFQHAGEAGVVAAYVLDPLIEDTIREAVHKTADGAVLALEPALARDIVAAVGRSVTANPGDGAVLLTTAEIRRHVRRLLEAEHPTLPVLSYQELVPEAQIRTVARIAI
jgi:type III secretion protein V